MSNYFGDRSGGLIHGHPQRLTHRERGASQGRPWITRAGTGSFRTCLDNIRFRPAAQAASRRITNHVAPATSAEAGIVKIHAQTMRPATPQRTAEKRWMAPTPMIEPVMVCVVLTGMPARAVPISVTAPAVSAQEPPQGRSLVMRIPMVLTLRQPPAIGPGPSAACAASTTQNGT